MDKMLIIKDNKNLIEAIFKKKETVFVLNIM